MNKATFRIATAAFVIAIIGAILLLVPPVSAQESGPTPAPTTASTQVTADAQATTAKTPDWKTPDLIVLVKWVLAGTIVLWAILFIYTGWIQGRYLKAAVSLGNAGIMSVPSVDGSEAFPLVGAAKEAGTLRVKGPAIVTLGVQSPEFKATKEDGGSDPIDATWEVQPSSAAIVVPATGASVSVVAAINCVFKLKASAPGGVPSAAVDVVAIPPQPGPSKVELPVFGRGYGSIAVAVVVLAVVVLLGLSSILTEAAIAALLGALVGYIFNGRASTPSSTAPGTSATKTG